jgi:gamma-butyrobetaine hydroxylase
MFPTTDVLDLHDRWLEIHWADGHHSIFHYLWLRDNCPTNRHRDNNQRLVDIRAMPADSWPAAASLTGDNHLAIDWHNQDHHSRFPLAWLRTHCYSAPPPPKPPAPILWNASLIDALPAASYNAVTSDPQALARWLSFVRDYGFALLHDLPPQNGTVAKVAELFGYIRQTNYGRIFDVKTVSQPNNLAYTGLALPLHTDNPYRDPVPTVQLLHCLSASISGGESILVDGFAVATSLRREHPEYFAHLTTQPVSFHFSDRQSDLRFQAPFIQLNAHDRIAAVRYNNRSIEPFHCPPDQMDAFYAAYRLFVEQLENPANQLRFKLTPGDLFIVDNQRILHGRTGFAGAGQRHLQGCYADRDGLYSRLAVLSRPKPQEPIHA